MCQFVFFFILLHNNKLAYCGCMCVCVCVWYRALIQTRTCIGSFACKPTHTYSCFIVLWQMSNYYYTNSRKQHHTHTNIQRMQSRSTYLTKCLTMDWMGLCAAVCITYISNLYLQYLHQSIVCGCGISTCVRTATCNQKYALIDLLRACVSSCRSRCENDNVIGYLFFGGINPIHKFFRSYVSKIIINFMALADVQ